MSEMRKNLPTSGAVGTLHEKSSPKSVARYTLTAILLLVARGFAADFTPPPLPPEITFPSTKIIKITDTGALPDGKTLCTDAIKNAIDQCSAAGGGIVQFPKQGAAEYFTGPH